MRVFIAKEVLDQFPDATVHGVVFDHLEAFKADAAEIWRRQVEQHLQGCSPDLETLAESTPVNEWRAAFKQFGVKPSKYRSSVEQLYRRALKGDLIRTQLPSVDLYCYVSLLTWTPAGAYDLEKVHGDISIRLSEAGEEFTPIGADLPLSCKPGVVVYADEGGITCYAWNYRDAARTCLDSNTRKAIFFADAVSAQGAVRAAEAVRMLSTALSEAGCVQVGVFTLDGARREVDIEV